MYYGETAAYCSLLLLSSLPFNLKQLNIEKELQNTKTLHVIYTLPLMHKIVITNQYKTLTRVEKVDLFNNWSIDIK